MKIEDTKVTNAGVFRCCSATVAALLKEVEIGDRTKCIHCDEEFVLVMVKNQAVWTPLKQLEEKDR